MLFFIVITKNISFKDDGLNYQKSNNINFCDIFVRLPFYLYDFRHTVYLKAYNFASSTNR